MGNTPQAINEANAGSGVSTRRLKLSKRQAQHLFAYFAIMLLFGIALTGLVLSEDTQATDSPNRWTTLGAIGMALLGSSIYYIRKLYKELISATLEIASDRDSEMHRLGVTVYFISRPLFACGFALLIFAICKGGLSASVRGAYQTSNGFQYIVMVLSFLGGFLSGQFVRQLEDSGAHWLPRMGKDSK